MTGGFLSHFTGLVAESLRSRLESLDRPGLVGQITLERPAVKQHGDLATNIAMVAAGAAGQPPMQLAQEFVKDLSASDELQQYCHSIEIAGPGFINFILSADALVKGVRGALELGGGFGAGEEEHPEKILLEFVSANPTGPLHAGHARYAAYGDALRRILTFAGHQVTTEFYINDYGSQMDLFAGSLAARYGEILGRKVPFPADGYRGDYIVSLAEKIKGEAGERFIDDVDPAPGAAALDFFKSRGCELVLEEMRLELDRFRVHFDSWFPEAGLYLSGEAQAALDALKSGGEAVEREGALWLLTTRYGDDKDRVLVRSSGEPTYFASDIAYHRDKLSRGYERFINIWGADHHGYVTRMKAAFEALAHDPGRLEIIIGQLVNVVEMGERQQMSKRAGRMVTLKELLDSIGVDAARFFLVDRSHDSTLDLDLEKARLKSEENPVYYVQYAHARICSILRKAGEEGVNPADDRDLKALEPQERELVLKLLEFPAVVLAAADTRGPQRLTGYARELAATFHVFYHNCPVVKAAPHIARFRLDLCVLTRNVIHKCLDLVGVSAPESM